MGVGDAVVVPVPAPVSTGRKTAVTNAAVGLAIALLEVLVGAANVFVGRLDARVAVGASVRVGPLPAEVLVGAGDVFVGGWVLIGAVVGVRDGPVVGTVWYKRAPQVSLAGTKMPAAIRTTSISVSFW